MSELRDKIRNIKDDHIHGSSFLLQEIIKVFISIRQSENETSRSFSELEKIDPTMAVVHHFLKELKPAIGHNFHQEVVNYQNKWQNVNIDIANNLQKHLAVKQLTILTHSHSGVVLDVLKNFLSKGYKIDVIQTASEPGGEGHIQAQAIAKLGIKAKVIRDENIVNSIDQVICCFLGVDRFNKASFVNKVNSKAIVEAACNVNKPVFVIGDSRKMVNSVEPVISELFESTPIKKNVKLISEVSKYI